MAVIELHRQNIFAIFKTKKMEKKKDGFINQHAIVLPIEIKNILKQKELTSLLHITDLGHYPHATNHYRIREKGIEEHIFIYCDKGEGWYSINGERHFVKEGDFFIIEANQPHAYAASEKNPWSIYWIHFTGTKSEFFYSIFNKTLNIDVGSPSARIMDRIALFDEIYHVLEMGYSEDNLEYVALCFWHFIASLKFTSQYQMINQIKRGDVIQQCISYMKENMDKKLTLEDFAHEVNYSPSYFGQLFLKRTGYSPLNYFNQLKIQKACQLLDFSNMKIKEIAYHLGFYDQYHFSKTFVKVMSESPSVYRKKKKG